MSTPRDTGKALHFLLSGVLVGMLGGIVMALFTMLATATYLNMDFFTPLYAIAAPLVGQEPLMTSLRQGNFYLAIGQALLGVLVMLVMIFIVVPIAGAPNLLQLLGSFSFIFANALFYGLPLGLWPVVQPQLFAAQPARQAV